jgi:hypothetical protein
MKVYEFQKDEPRSIGAERLYEQLVAARLLTG